MHKLVPIVRNAGEEDCIVLEQVQAGEGKRDGDVEMVTGWICDHRGLWSPLHRFVQTGHASIDADRLRIGLAPMPQSRNPDSGRELPSDPNVPEADTAKPHYQETFEHGWSGDRSPRR